MRKVPAKICGVLLFSLMIGSLRAQAFQNRSMRHPTKLPEKAARIQIPIGISEALWQQRIPTDNPISPGKVALGQALYFDKRLSIDGTVSCATCHDPAVAFTDSNFVAIGAGGKRGSRNSPTVLNVMFGKSLFWDGRAASLEEQAKHPLMSSFEMGMGSGQELIRRVGSVPAYQRLFKQVFKSEGIDLNTIVKAIATYERTLLSGNSPFDRYIVRTTKAITDAQQRGWELFKGKAKCIECHAYSLTTPFFTDFEFHNTGVAGTDTMFDTLVRDVTKSSEETALTLLAHSAGFSELGRFAVTLQGADLGAFKTPTLRDIELTSPYMHNGSIKTLIDVVRFYNRGGNPNSHLDERMRPLNLTDAEINDLVEFMRALTSADVLKQCQTATPQNREPVPLPN